MSKDTKELSISSSSGFLYVKYSILSQETSISLMFLITALLCVALFVKWDLHIIQAIAFLEHGIVRNLIPNGFFKSMIQSHIWMLNKPQTSSNKLFFEVCKGHKLNEERILFGVVGVSFFLLNSFPVNSMLSVKILGC